MQFLIIPLIIKCCCCLKTTWTREQEERNKDIAYGVSKLVSMIVVILSPIIQNSFGVKWDCIQKQMVINVVCWILPELFATAVRCLAGWYVFRDENHERDMLDDYLGPSLTVRLFQRLCGCWTIQPRTFNDDHLNDFLVTNGTPGIIQGSSPVHLDLENDLA